MVWLPEVANLQNRLRMYEDVFQLLYDGIIVVDKQGYVTLLSDAYASFLGIEDSHSAIGLHCTQVVENTRMHAVLQTGQAELGHVQRVNGRDIIVSRIPYYRDGELAGAVGKVMFTDIHELKILANRLNSMETKLEYYRTELKRVQGAKYSFESIVGRSEKIKEAKALAMKVASSRSTILIRGESGTGKELFGHAIHHSSPRGDGPFVRINCAAIPAELLESELFGYEEGAFTGAKKGGKPGKIELASGGTLFLDEIGDMPLDMQAKLLRVIQEKEFERIGGTKINHVDVRFIAATHRDLEEMVEKGKFREDLFYRLNVFTVEVPALRERAEDILVVAQYLIGKLNQELGTNVTGMEDRVIALFNQYPWHGNIRELENVLERAMNVADGQVIRMEDLPMRVRKWVGEEDSHVAGSYLLQDEVEGAEKKAILKALQKTAGNRQQAAELLGIHRASLYRKMDKYGIGEELLQENDRNER